MISYTQALKLVLQAAHTLDDETVPVEHAVGKVLCESITSAINVAPFRNSAMDGFAVRATDVENCSAEKPISLPIAGVIFAGETPASKYPNNSAVKIMTGAIVPDQFDTVVRFEDTTYTNIEATFIKPIETGSNVRLAGEDIADGDLLFESGYQLRSLDIGVLASIGLAGVNVIRKPTVTIAGTGDELVQPGKQLLPGQIYNSNEATIRSMVEPFCTRIEIMRPRGDSVESLRHLFDTDSDVIITSGGVSAGEKDLLVPTAESCGWKRIFHKARIKPGKPVYVAVRGNQLLFGLPGNPLSAAVTCAVFAVSALKKLAGRKDHSPLPVEAKLDPNSIRKSGRMLIWPGKIRCRDGETIVEFADKKSSAALSALIGSDGLIFQNQNQEDDSLPEIGALTWQRILQ